MAFAVRKTKPEKGNKYYIRKDSGGYSNAILGKPTDSECNVLSNCVGYAYGRFNEIGGYGSCKYLKPVNAENFIAYKGDLRVGKEPKLGACIVWQGGPTNKSHDGAGHVAIVEQVNPDGSILTSESGYNSAKAFWTRTRTNANGNWGQGSAYKFLGFIYNPAVSDNDKIIKAPVYVGYLDTATINGFTGWAWNSCDDTALKVDIKVYKENVLKKTLTTTAGNYRADLKNAKKGNGKHGFSLKFDFNTLGAGTYIVRAYTNGKCLNNTKTVVVEEKKALVKYRIYIVQPKDNLTKIAAKYKTTVDELVKLNNIPNRNLIRIGQKLKIPM